MDMRSDFLKIHSEFCDRIKEVTKKKNADYTGAGDNPYANFEAVEKLGAATTEQGLYTRMTDKMTRLATYVKRSSFEVEDESVEDTLLDLANYAILMSCYLKHKSPEKYPSVKKNE